ncbi:MAG: DmsE family decaheme c-type cytochrome [Bryobacterales bacterium]|nr:DmsE family decaheme c-type cytochrome [Bryobacterales bacterium]
MRMLLVIILLGMPLVGQEKKAAPEYMGSAVCQGCHEELFQSFTKSPHYRVETDSKHGFAEKSCESCHGPGSAHAESATPSDIRNPLRLSAPQSNRVCLGCHLNQPSRVGAIRGGHARNQVACTSCHSVHKPKPKDYVTNCGTCHVATLAQFQRPYRHKLQEGGIGCVDCHNPHGRLLTNALRDVSSNEPGCLRCHGDKRGPFAFEHAPMRMEGCSACHESHGSSNPRMLTRPQVAQQCLECHSNLGTNSRTLGGIPPAFHDLANPRIRSCTGCHVKIHGSHVNRTLLR